MKKAHGMWFIKEGAGKLTTKYDLTKYTILFGSRFETGVGTNPEELIAAAHSGCFTVQLSAYISELVTKIDSIETKCVGRFQDGSGSFQCQSTRN
jgi:osmotically inducible protein OsmC